MNILSYKGLIYNASNLLTIIKGDNFCYKDHFLYIKELIRQRFECFRKSKNMKILKEAKEKVICFTDSLAMKKLN